MAPPGIMSLEEHLDNIGMPFRNTSAPVFNFSSTSSLNTAPLSKGISPSVFHDHDYYLKPEKNVIDSRKDTLVNEEIDMDCIIDFEDVMVCKDTGDAALMSKSANAPNDNCDTSRSGWTGTDNEEAIDDSDIFHGLDELDFDLDDLDPFTDMGTEDAFQHFFIDETLNNSMSHKRDEDNDCNATKGGDQEDTHKKDFFFKLLELQTASYVPEQISIDGFASDISNLPMKSHPTPVDLPLYSPSSNTSSHACDDLSCFESNLCFTTSQMDTFTSTSCVTSVPAKMCSRCSVDWKGSVLYSTAPVCSNGRVQTNLSTVTTKSLPDMSDNGYLARHDTNVPNSHTSPDGHNSINPFHSHTLAQVGVTQVRDDQDTADEILRWLEEDETSTTSAFDSTTKTEGSKCHVDHPAPSRLDVTNLTTTKPLSPSTVQSLTDSDSFIDLEDYATESASPSLSVVKDDSQWDHTIDHVTDMKPNEKSRSIQSKYLHNSELRFRLSLLDDLSKGFMNDRDLQKRDSLGHPACQLLGTDSDDTFMDSTWGFTIEMENSPLSPYSSSSIQSSRRPSNGANDSLDLLGLFSDENSSMLMERSDVAVSSMALL